MTFLNGQEVSLRIKINIIKGVFANLGQRCEDTLSSASLPLSPALSLQQDKNQY